MFFLKWVKKSWRFVSADAHMRPTVVAELKIPDSSSVHVTTGPTEFGSLLTLTS